MNIVEIDLNALSEVIDETTGAILGAYQQNPLPHDELGDPQVLSENLQQFIGILQHVDAGQQPDPGRDPTGDNTKLTELDELGDYGLTLLDGLGEWARKLELNDTQATLRELSIPVALWTARHIGTLSELESVVNALSRIANQNQDPGFLRELSDIMDEIANAAAPPIKQDLDKSNPNRPWRILNLNLGIVATRTQDPDIIEPVYAQILTRLPDDAPNFFREGMEQMDRIGYPTHVRQVVEKYYRLTNNPTLH